MRETEKQKDARKRMSPGVITAQGFLGTDGRNLADIVEADEEEFRRHGLDPEGAAAALERMKSEGTKGLGGPVTAGDDLVVTVGDARGVLPCPFSDGAFHKNSVTAERPSTGDRIVYSDLSIHLLRVHHFCQGAGSPFRLDPAVLAGFPGMKE